MEELSEGPVRGLYPDGPGAVTVYQEHEAVRQILSELLRVQDVGKNLRGLDSDFHKSLEGFRLPTELDTTALSDRIWGLPETGAPLDLNYQLSHATASECGLPTSLAPGLPVRLRGKIRDARHVSRVAFSVAFQGQRLARVTMDGESPIVFNRTWATTPWIFVLGRIVRLRPLNVRAASITLDPKG